MKCNKPAKLAYVVSVNHVDRCWRAKLTVTHEATFASTSAAEEFVTRKVMAAYDHRKGKNHNRVKVKDWRVVDALGLLRLQAAQKASTTLRRRRAAKRAAATRARNAAERIRRSMPFGF